MDDNDSKTLRVNKNFKKRGRGGGGEYVRTGPKSILLTKKMINMTD